MKRSRWFIVDGLAGKYCILPDGEVLYSRLKVGCTIKAVFKCCGLLDAMDKLHNFERKGA